MNGCRQILAAPGRTRTLLRPSVSQMGKLPVSGVAFPVTARHAHAIFMPGEASKLQVAPWAENIPDESMIKSTCSIARLNPGGLRQTARATAAAGIRDPFLWKAIRLRARVLAPWLDIGQMSTLLGCCVVVGLVDVQFLDDMCDRLEFLINFGGRSTLSVKALIISCNALLRLGLNPKSSLLHDLIRSTALSTTTFTVGDASLLATCLARMKLWDRVLLVRASDHILNNSENASLKQLAMVFAAIVHLNRSGVRDHRVDTLQSSVAARLQVLIASGTVVGLRADVGVKDLRRTLFIVLAAEERRHALVGNNETSALALATVQRLHGLRRIIAQPAELQHAAAACRRWSGSNTFVSTLTPPALKELAAWATGRRPTWSPLSMQRLLYLFGAILPQFCALSTVDSEQTAPTVSSAVSALLNHIGNTAADLSEAELLAATELCSIGLITFPSINALMSESQAQPSTASVALVFRSEVYKRAHDLSLNELPRVLASLLQILPNEEIAPVLRRCTGRIAADLTDALEKEAAQRIEWLSSIMNADALGEFLYVCATCGYRDDGFLKVCRGWLLAADGALLASVTRDVSLVHLLHSLAVLEAAKGDLLDALVNVSEPLLSRFGAFELLGFLDAIALLQEQVGKLQDKDSRSTMEPLGVSQSVFRAALARAELLLDVLEPDELRSFKQLLQALELPEGSEDIVAMVSSKLGEDER